MDSQHEAPTEPFTKGSHSPIVNSNTSIQSPIVRTRRGNPLLAFLLFLLGILLGILATLFFVIFVAHDRTPIQTTPSTQPSSVIVQVSNVYLTQLVTGKLKTSGLPGEVSNVQVVLTNTNSIQVSGTDTVSVLGLGIPTPFSFTLQPYIQSCQAQVHLISADLGNLPVTNFAQTYENQINQDIQLKVSDLPAGFTYCATSTRTQPDMLSIVYSAKPV